MKFQSEDGKRGLRSAAVKQSFSGEDSLRNSTNIYGMRFSLESLSFLSNLTQRLKKKFSGIQIFLCLNFPHKSLRYGRDPTCTGFFSNIESVDRAYKCKV